MNGGCGMIRRHGEEKCRMNDFSVYTAAEWAYRLFISKGDETMTTYEMIKTLPGKTTNWRNLVDALSANYVAAYAAKYSAAPYAPNTTDEWANARTVRELRFAAMCAANCYVGFMAQQSSFIPPSPETLAWGGFLGGETVVWTDRDCEANAIEVVRRIIATA